MRPSQDTFSIKLPAEGFARDRTVAAVVGISKSALWSWCREGRFPPPVRLSPKCTAWSVGAVREWLADPIGWQAAHAKVEG